MNKDLNDSDFQNSSVSREDEDEQSLVGKLKKNVTEIISNTPLSKWFKRQNENSSASTRRRQDDSDDETDCQEFQPPTKRAKLPNTKETLELDISETLSPIASVSDFKKPMYRNFPEPIPGPSGYQTRKLLSSTSLGSKNIFKVPKTNSEASEHVFKNPGAVVGESVVNNNANKETNSDSEESTSGYSSGRIGSKEVVSQENSKQTSPSDNSPIKARSLFQNSSSGRSLFSDRSLSPHRNSSLSSRMPSFNPSSFGSPNFIDRTLSTKRILDSPFYSGRTIYGGASAYGRSTGRAPQDLRKTLRQSVSIKPMNKNVEKSNLQLGKTARRILDTLEQYSSPISDAKKIPVSSKRLRTDGTLSKYLGANPYTIRDTRGASNKELQVPSVTDLLKMKLDQQKTRLQDSTEAVRQIASKSKSVLNEESYQIAVTVQNSKEKHVGKMKTKITSVRQKNQEDEIMPELKLNPVSLPIKEMPKFDIVVPPPSQKPSTPLVHSKSNENAPLISSKPTLMFKSSANNNNLGKLTEISASCNKISDCVKTTKPSGDFSTDFTFSAPLILAECLKPIKAINNFKFSEPLIKRRRSIHAELDTKENLDGKTKKINGENVAGLLSNKENKMDFNITGNTSLAEKFKPKEGTWECSVCMIRNQADKSKCIACEAPKAPGTKADTKPFVNSLKTINPFTQAPSATSFGDKFKPPSSTWECSTCMIRNKEEVVKCVACETQKPGTSTTITSVPSQALGTNVGTNVSSSLTGFGNKFSPALSTWECPTCMIRNKDVVLKCVACETQKPDAKKAVNTSKSNVSSSSSLGSVFKAPPDTWECPTCMIRNKEELSKCAACETVRPGNKTISTLPSFGSEFKKKEDEWECEVCMVKNKGTTSKCQCCEALKPGSSSALTIPKTAESSKVSSFNFGIDRTTATSFTFGVPANAQSNLNTVKSNAAVVFGESRKQPTSNDKEKPKFSFGVPSSTPATTTSTETKKDVPSFSFSSPKTTDKVEPKKDSSTLLNNDKPQSGLVSVNKTEEALQKTSTPGFLFSTTSKVEEKSKEESTKKIEEGRSNPLLKPTEKLPEKAPVAPAGFSFGLAKGSVTLTSATQLTNSKPTEPSTDESPSKKSKPTSEAPVFKFNPSANGDTTLTKDPVVPVGSGFFGTVKPRETGPATFTAPSPFTTTASQGDSSNNMFKFGARSDTPQQKNGISFGASATPAVAAKEPTSSAEVKPFSFNNPVPPTTQTSLGAVSVPAAPSFGAAAPSSSIFKFGGSSNSTTDNKLATTTATPSFSFSAPNAENKATPQFSFGSSSVPNFNFGQASTATPSFNFGPTNKKADSVFGAGTSTNNPFTAPNSKPESTFGAVQAQNSTPNGMFNFGSGAATNQKAGFSFGATSGTNQATGSSGAQGGFNFGSAAATTATPSGGFNFSASAPKFDVNVTPMFNFTGGVGVPAFSAPPSQDGAGPQRKIKKAVRRTVR